VTSTVTRIELDVHIAKLDEAEAITETLSLAFHDDPTWSWAFPDAERRQENYRIWWRLLVENAMRYPWVFATENHEVASVWLPPDGTELRPEDEARVEPLFEEMVGDHAPAVMELQARFEKARPRTANYYLSLLGVHNDHRGKGLGMGMLAENLERIDALGVPTYLESSNAANNPKYERMGYERIGEFTTPDDAAVITQYWREVP
jgi:GNAT superfamily N-acetyltransferase